MKNKVENVRDNKKKYYLYIWVGFLVVVSVVNIFLFFSHNTSKALRGKIPNEDLLNPDVDIFNGKDMIVNFQPLRVYLNNTYQNNPNVSIYFEYLNTGANIAINKDAEFFPASLLKTPLAMAAVKKIERGEWKWSNELVLMAGDKDQLFGDMWKDDVGTRYTIETLINNVLAKSDNTAHYILLRNLEESELSNVYNYLGLQDFFDSNGKISAKNYAVILRSLYDATFLSRDDSEKLLQIMTTSPFNQYLQQGLPSGVKFSHKIGVNKDEQVIMDAGLVYYPDRPYTLIVMVKTADENAAEKIMSDVSKHISDYVSSYNVVP